MLVKDTTNTMGLRTLETLFNVSLWIPQSKAHSERDPKVDSLHQ
jgi:hypothetical protein